MLDAWPSYPAYVDSFLTIGAGWPATPSSPIGPRGPTRPCRGSTCCYCRGGVPAVPTKLVADALHHESSERVFVTMYGLTLLAIRLLAFALDAYARRERLYSTQDEGDERLDEPRELVPVIGGCEIAILIGLAVPGVAVAIYFVVALYMIFSGRSEGTDSVPTDPPVKMLP